MTKYIKQICRICGKEFTGREHRKTCSRVCGNIYRGRNKELRKQHEIKTGKRICSRCKIEYDLSEFTSSGARSIYCRKCWNKYTVDQFNKQKKKFVDMLGGKCSRCGYSRYIGALEFHHKNPIEKEFNIRCKSRPEKELEVEISKCILLCPNCHREVHEELRDYNLLDVHT